MPDRIEREIEEILSKLDTEGAPKGGAPKGGAPRGGAPTGGGPTGGHEPIKFDPKRRRRGPGPLTRLRNAFGVQLGGGTDINSAIAYCQRLVGRPAGEARQREAGIRALCLRADQALL